MKEKLNNLYPISKTLQFSLIPIGKTEENFNKKLLLEQDQKRAEDYVQVKEYIDRYHKAYIEKQLNKVTELPDIKEYAELYFKSNKTDAENGRMASIEESMRKFISTKLKDSDEYKMLSSKDLIEDKLPAFLTDSKETQIVNNFKGFTTYFYGFFENRKNMYSDEDKSTSIAHRAVSDNLPKFLDNMKSFSKIKDALADKIEELNDNFFELVGFNVEDAFCLDFFALHLSQSGIDGYNAILGGYSNSDGTKIRGLNEYINLYNQQIVKVDKSKRLPQLKTLYKQILSDRSSVSFVTDKFQDDNDLLRATNCYIEKILEKLTDIVILFEHLNEFDLNGIYVTSGLAVTNISQAVSNDWNAFRSAWNDKYDETHKKGKNIEKYNSARDSEYKKNKSFSLNQIESFVKMGNPDGIKVSNYVKDLILNDVASVKENYSKAKLLLCKEYTDEQKLQSNKEYVELIKNLLDSVKDLERHVKMLLGSGKEDNKDEVFYGELLPIYDEILLIDHLYDKVRNYLTQKPYKKDKIKLNFENPQLLAGWDKNKESAYRSVLLRKEEKYYLAIMDKNNSKVFAEPHLNGKEYYQKIEYKLLPGPNKMLPKVFFSNKNIEYYAPNAEIMNIYSDESFKKSSSKFNINNCRKLIDFFKESINKHEDWSKFGFKFKDTCEYNGIDEFYRDIANQGYSINYQNVDNEYVESMIDKGDLYLFQIYSKDFSAYSHGKPNLHTLYFKMLFDERNLNDVVFQLNGGAEMFYREASISDKEKIVHWANRPIENKNPDNIKKTSVFPMKSQKMLVLRGDSFHCIYQLL